MPKFERTPNVDEAVDLTEEAEAIPEKRLKPPPKPKAEEVTELTDADFIEESGIQKRPREIEGEYIPDDEVLELHEPGEFQEHDVVNAFKIDGFKDVSVAATLEKKDERKGTESLNEDNIIADPKTGLIGVLDGLGGEGEAGAGAKASMRAQELIPKRFAELLGDPNALNTVEQRLIDHQLNKKNPQTPELKLQYQKQLTEMVEGIILKDPHMARKALALIEAIRQSNRHIEDTGGKTTASVGFIHETPDKERYAVIASIGDSPVMKRRANGELVPITKEDSLLNSLLDSGAITEKKVEELRKTPDKDVPIPITLELIQAMGGGQKEYDALKARGTNKLPISYKKMKSAMIGSMGDATAEASLNIRRLDPGDELIFASDGLTDKYETAEGETDMDEVEKLFKGTSLTNDLEHARKAAKSKTSAAKKDDDIAIITAKAA